MTSSALPLVEKRTFELPALVTQSGATITPVRVGWESYGTLNEDRSNAILVCHFFSGTSHAAGRYAPDDPLPGYWDAIIGPGKAIDTDKFFVLSSDTLVNLNARDPKVVTTGPTSTNPATGRPYGADFPVVGIRDFVEVQKALVESLGIRKLHAVVGPSMGGLQTFEWACAYPEMVGRIMPVISAAEGHPWLVAWLDVWAAPVRLDPKWQGGAYDPADPPVAGLTQALKIVTLHALDAPFIAAQFGRAWADPGLDPRVSMVHRYKVEAGLEMLAAARAAISDANHFLALVRANQIFVPLAERDPAHLPSMPALLLYAPTDHVFLAGWIEETAARLRAAGAQVEVAPIRGIMGHLDGVASLAAQADRIAAFLAG